MNKEFIGTCIENCFGAMDVLVNVVENYSEEITKEDFLKNCAVDDSVIKEMNKRPDDFEFYKGKEYYGNNYYVYFYRHSGIEHFYR